MINENKLLALIEKVCSRPKRYTRNGRFQEVATYTGKKGISAIEGEFDYHSIFTPFLKWFASKMNEKMVINMESFQNSFSSEDEALRNFPVLYKEYIQSL